MSKAELDRAALGLPLRQADPDTFRHEPPAMTDKSGDVGALPSDRAVVNRASDAASALRASVPSAAQSLDPASFEPIIRKAADDFYERVMHSCEDYLRDNAEYNIGAHVDMLERENQRMRTELYEVDRALGGLCLGHETRLNAIKELNDRHNQAVNECWRLRGELAVRKDAPESDQP